MCDFSGLKTVIGFIISKILLSGLRCSKARLGDGFRINHNPVDRYRGINSQLRYPVISVSHLLKIFTSLLCSLASNLSLQRLQTLLGQQCSRTYLFSLISYLQCKLFYLEGAPRFRKSPPGATTGFLGKQTKLQCDFLGNPTPEVTWARSPREPLPQGRSEVKKDGLYINNTEREDGGVYTCYARNDYGINLHGTFLKVKSVGK